MAVVTLKELKTPCPKGKRLMGIDQSKNALGLADFQSESHHRHAGSAPSHAQNSRRT